MFFVLILFFSISAIQANEVISDSAAIDSSGDALQLDDDAQFSDLKANNSNDLLTDHAEETVKNQTQLSGLTTNTYINGHYSVDLTDLNTNISLANKSVNFKVNNVDYANTTDSNGIASINLKLNPGKYTITTYFEGDETYNATSLTSTVEILPTIKANDITKYYKGNAQYSATFLDSYGKALANTMVSISVNGKVYNKKTDAKGVVNLPVNLKPGTYKVISTDPNTGYKLTTTFKILSTITASDIKNVVGDSRKFTAKFFKSNGKALANKYVKFKVRSKIYKVKTNSKGIARLSLKKFKKGTYKVISYNADGLTKTNKFKIYPKASTKLASNFYTFIPNEVRDIKVKLTTSLNDYSNVGKVIKIIINGKAYYKKTNKDGVATLNLKSFKKGLYTVEYKYVGNKFFKSSKSSNLVTILDTTVPKLTVKSTTKFGYGAYTPIKVALTAGGVPLVKRTMTFTIEGKTYTTITDNNGIGSVPIDLKIGKYTITYKTNTKFKVNGTSGSCDITVFKRSPSKVVWKSGTYYKDNLQVFKILLTDSNGKPISGGIIELTIDGETYTRKTASNGYATFKTSVALGNYKVSFKFLGNNNFLPSTNHKSITVKLSKFGSGINEKNYISYLSAYLQSTRNCPVNHAKIKALVKSLTSGLSNKIDKAKAIFNYVRDYISYDYYYNSHKGALGALSSKSANCVDQASLLVAMYRTAGFKARYVHGTCVFSDGIYGHVWTQVLIDDTWVIGDSINPRNSLGKIKNWNTNTYHLKSKYLSVPF